MGTWEASLLPPRAGHQACLLRFPCAVGAVALPSTLSFGSLALCSHCPCAFWASAQGCASPVALSSLLLHFQPDLFLLLCSSAVFLAIKPTPGFFCTMSLMQRAAAALSQQHCRLCVTAGGFSAPAEQQHLPQLAAPPDASTPCGTASKTTAPAPVVHAGEQDQTSSCLPMFPGTMPGPSCTEQLARSCPLTRPVL